MDEILNHFKVKSFSSGNNKLDNNNNNDIKNIINNNIVNYSLSTNAYTNSTKKITNNKTTNLNDDFSKFRLGLLSAGSSSYSNVINPIWSLTRPLSNFNSDEDKFWNKIFREAKNFESENKHKEKEEKILFKNNNMNGVLNSINIIYKIKKYEKKEIQKIIMIQCIKIWKAYSLNFME